MNQLHDADVAVDLIDPPARPARESMDPDKLGDLADDMAVNGLLQPVGLIGPDPAGRYEICWGHRRTMAARLLGWRTIRARCAPAGTVPAAMRAAENNVREQLNPREEARQVKELLDANVPLAQIRRTLRRSEGWIEQRLALLSWPADIQDAVAAGELPLAVGAQLVKVAHDGYRRELVNEALRTGATARTAAAWAAHYEADRARIESNHATVHEMIERRDAFLIMADCESCGTRVPMKGTRLIRICGGCSAELAAAQAEQAAGSSTS